MFEAEPMQASLRSLTESWGDHESVSLYLNRCQVDTPPRIVEAVWKHVRKKRRRIKKVIDFGAGDGRFALSGKFEEYVGFEIDEGRLAPTCQGARIINDCAFSIEIDDADLCIGNPPFVRNQDLPVGWREKASRILLDRTGVAISGLANAWQYFFLLGLASVKSDGLCALVIPYEWVSRPSSNGIRTYISKNSWDVDVYRLVDETFDSVLTTASITIVNKKSKKGIWRYFEESIDGKFTQIPSPSGSSDGVIAYEQRRAKDDQNPQAKRGLSPGTQKVLTLTEGERVSNGLRKKIDVVPCVTSLKPLPSHVVDFDQDAFDAYFRHAGHKCWIIRTDRHPSNQLSAYLASVPPELYQTKTCMERREWWRFKMPSPADALLSQTFKGKFPKSVKNSVGAIAVGGVCGLYKLNEREISRIVSGLDGMDIGDQVVSYANGLRKIEINQLNWVLSNVLKERAR